MAAAASDASTTTPALDDAADSKRRRTSRETYDEEVRARLLSATVVSAFPEAEAASAGGVIGTHFGAFHCDEALACGLLKLLPRFQAFPVLRTRNEELLRRATVVVDVGGVYDAAALRFDHHQNTFTESYDGPGSASLPPIKMSSAGLVYKHFGADLVRAVAEGLGVGPLSDATLLRMQEKMYRNLIREVDAIDNGVEIVDKAVFEGRPDSEWKGTRYLIQSHLSSRVGRLNPAWNEDQSSDAENRQFRLAMHTAVSEFVDILRGLLLQWLPARSIVEDAVARAADVHPSGAVLVLDRFCPWKSHLGDIEDEVNEARENEARAKAGLPPKAETTKPAEGAGAAGGGGGGGSSDADPAPAPAAADVEFEKMRVLFVCFPDSHGMWRVQTVSQEGSFESRKSLPKPWRGLRDAELSAIAGVSDCTFVRTWKQP